MKNFKLGLSLFIIGLLSILPLTFVKLNVNDVPISVRHIFTPVLWNLYMVIGQITLLAIFIIIGTKLRRQLKLEVPTITKFIDREEKSQIEFINQLKTGITYGICIGVLLFVTNYFLKFSVPHELNSIYKSFKINTFFTTLQKGVAGGLIAHYGIMSLFIWLTFKIKKQLNNSTYWTGLIITTIIIGLLQILPLYNFRNEENIIYYIILCCINLIGNSTFGWLYWKHGLETAIIGSTTSVGTTLILFDILNCIKN